MKQTTSIPPTTSKDWSWLKGRLRREPLFALILLFAVFVCWFPRLKGPIDLRWDGGVYYVLGTSLAEGRGYRLLNEPGDIEAIQYPPLLPAIIALHQRALRTNDPLVVGRWLRITYFIIFNIYILAVYLLLRHYLPSKYALLAVLVSLFSLHTYFLSDLCFPEIPFALMTVLFFICNRKSGKPVYGFMSGVFAVAAYALRTSGIALLAAWVCESILNKEFKKALLRSAVSAFAVFGWMAYISAVESSEQYKKPSYEYQRAEYLFYNVSYNKNIFPLKDPFAPELGTASSRDIAIRFLNNLKIIPIAVGEVLTTRKRLWEAAWEKIDQRLPIPLGSSKIVIVPLILLGCLVLIGILFQLAGRQKIIPLYVLFSIAAMCITPFPDQFNRYLAPLVPFLALSLIALLLKFKQYSREQFPRRLKPAGAAIAATVIVVILIQQSLTFYLAQSQWLRKVVYHNRNGETVTYRLFIYFDAYRAFDAGIDWLKPRANPGDVVASSMPHWVYLRTGLKSVMPPFESNPHEAQRLLDSVPVSYLIVDEGLALDTRKYTSPVTQTFPDRWRRVYSDSITTDTGEVIKDRFQIYQRIH